VVCVSEDVHLSRVTRDIRVLGRHPDADWRARPGVLVPFGGLLQPGPSTGESPPPTLSHLALGGLLADALGPTRTGTADSGRTVEQPPGPADTDEAATDESGEPTVREVLREEEPTAGTLDDVRMTPRDPVADRRETVVDPDGRADDRAGDPVDSWGDEPTATPGDSTATPGDSTATPGDPTAVGGSGDATSGVGTPPRTVVRRTAGSPATPATLGERRITRVVDTDVAGAGSSTESATDATEDAESGPSLEGGSWVQPPVERTMPTVPAAFGAVAGTDASPPGGTPAWGSQSGDGPPTPDAARSDTPGDAASSDTPGAGGQDAAGRDSLDFDTTPPTGSSAPPMTVLESARDDSDGREAGGAESSAPARTGEFPGRSGGATSDQADAADSEDAGTPGRAVTSGVDVDDEAGMARAIEAAVSQPRVVDRLFRELERRRRIERERRGRR
jgi:hypothetical protein